MSRTRHVNKVELVGKLIKDPEIKTTQNGKTYCTLVLVTEENRKNKNTGEWDKDSEIHNIVIWKNDAVSEISDPKSGVRKFATVSVTGKKKTRKWQGNDGVDRYTTEIIVDLFGEFAFLEAAQDRRSEDRKTPRTATPASVDMDDDNEQIPF